MVKHEPVYVGGNAVVPIPTLPIKDDVPFTYNNDEGFKDPLTQYQHYHYLK